MADCSATNKYEDNVMCVSYVPIEKSSEPFIEDEFPTKEQNVQVKAETSDAFTSTRSEKKRNRSRSRSRSRQRAIINQEDDDTDYYAHERKKRKRRPRSRSFSRCSSRSGIPIPDFPIYFFHFGKICYF